VLSTQSSSRELTPRELCRPGFASGGGLIQNGVVKRSASGSSPKANLDRPCQWGRGARRTPAVRPAISIGKNYVMQTAIAFCFAAMFALFASAADRVAPHVKWENAAWTDKLSGNKFQTASATVVPNKENVGAFVVIGRTNGAPYDLTITLERTAFRADHGHVVLQIKIDDAPPVKVTARYVDPLNSKCAALGSPPGLIERMITAKSIVIRARTFAGLTDLELNGPGKLKF